MCSLDVVGIPIFAVQSTKIKANDSELEDVEINIKLLNDSYYISREKMLIMCPLYREWLTTQAM